MEPDFPFAYILFALVLLVVIVAGIKRRQIAGDPIYRIRLITILFLIVCAIILLSLPSTPSLASFGYPNSTDQIATKEQLLKILQKYNLALVRTTEALNFFIFAFVAFFVLNYLGLLKEVQKLRKKFDNL